MIDWAAWHERYDDDLGPLARRLAVVQRFIREVVSANPGEPLEILSLCAGDGRDVLPVLEEWKGRREIAACLVELDPSLAERARAFAADRRVPDAEVVCGDAARTEHYAGAVPAGLVLVCGIFGNVSEDDVQSTIEAMPSLCRRRGAVIWTRHRREPDLTPSIRRWFADAGFAERAFESAGANEFAVGMHELTGAPRPLTPGPPLFTFVR